MFSTYGGAKKRAWTLHSTLLATEVDVTLSQCRHALARGAGYRDWEHLRRTLEGRLPRPANLEGFLERVALAMPTQAVGPTHRWVETELSFLRDRERGEARSTDRFFRDWYVKDSEAVFAIGVMHRATTPLLQPGSGRGQRLRLELVCQLCLGPAYATLDRETLTLAFHGKGEDIFGPRFAHPNFRREFDRLIAAGIFAWTGSLTEGGKLVLAPPSQEVVREHIRKCREFDAEHWRMDAEFRAQDRAAASSESTRTAIET